MGKQETTLDYLAKHLSLIDVCHYALSAKDGVTPSEVSRELGLSLQTASGYLKRLQARKILKMDNLDINRPGREHRYRVIDKDDLEKLLKEVLESAKSPKFKGRLFPMTLVLDMVYSRLQKSLSSYDTQVQLEKNITVRTELMDIRIPLRFKRVDEGGRIFFVFIARISDPEDILSILGRVYVLRESDIAGDIILIFLMDPSVRRWPIDLAWFDHIQDREYPEYPGIQLIIRYQWADSATLLREDYSNELARLILDSFALADSVKVTKPQS